MTLFYCTTEPVGLSGLQHRGKEESANIWSGGHICSRQNELTSHWIQT